MRFSAKADSALRASVDAAGDGPVKADAISRAQEIPLRFLEQILLDLKPAGVKKILGLHYLLSLGN